MSNDDFLTVPEAAERLRVGTTTARKLIREGKLAAYRPTPGRVYVTERAIEEFVREHESRGHDALIADPVRAVRQKLRETRPASQRRRKP